jgi:hypothetical protein
MIIKYFLIIKSCDIYVHVYGQKIYNQIFELNILNWYNIFTSEILKIIFFYRSMELKIWIKFNNLNLNFKSV